MSKNSTKIDRDGTSSLSASMRALHEDMKRRGYDPATTTTKTKVKE